MIPDGVSFDDAVIAEIESEDSTVVFSIEDVVVNDGEDVVSGTLTLDDVSAISIDGSNAEEVVMVTDAGEIQELEVLDGPVVKIQVTWSRPDSHEEEQNLYLIECRRVRWKASA